MENTDTLIFIKTTVKVNIEFFHLIINKTKNVTVIGYHRIHRAQRIIISYKINRIKKIILFLESELKKDVIETYMKMGIPMMWRKFFENIVVEKIRE